MMYQFKLLSLPVVLLAVFIQACNTTSKLNKPADNYNEVVEEDTLDEVTLTFQKEKVYRASYTKHFDLLDTKLELSVDWQKQHMPGKATLKLVPHFYPTNSLQLDAKGLEIRMVSLLEKDGRQTTLNYTYDSLKLNITLIKTITAKDTITVLIDYTAKPNERKAGGSAAIQSDKGLYFINPVGKEIGKPTQLWTQGETEANSCWFPTIDAPNQRCTGEITVTCEQKYLTLSNGILSKSKNNSDGTRTDTWVIEKPFAPYLFMLTIGEFAVVKDKWRNIAVDYYVEKDYAPYAKDIFGNTPEMLEYFSNILGVDYPWPKYAQIIVRDYVSGAMENTSASLFGEFVQRNKRELLDANYEDIVAHELFHQWFGDLVTCESWSNIPLNESFANYSEYLWADYKYGKNYADKLLQDNLKQYLDEAENRNVDLIRFYYDDKEEMFDRHSYEKGGHVLHMLRNIIGDEAFFKSLKLYLTKHQYHAVEIHDLRLAFEEVTGQDLNWFFNQWFMSKGHPKINFTYEYKNDSVFVTTEQSHNTDDPLIYELPFTIGIWKNNNASYHKVVLKKNKQTFSFKSAKPDLIDADAGRILLAVKKENKQLDEYIFQFNNHPAFLAKLEAIKKIKEAQAENENARKTLEAALNDSFYYFRRFAIDGLKLSSDSMPEVLKKIEFMALNDGHAGVRFTAVQKLSKQKNRRLLTIFEKALGDSSYATAAEALKAINLLDTTAALKYAKQFEAEQNYDMTDAVCSIYASQGTEDYQTFFEKKFLSVKGYAKYTLMYHYANFLTRMNKSLIIKGIELLKNQTLSTETKLLVSAGKSSLKRIVKSFEEKKKANQKIIDDPNQSNKENFAAMNSDYDTIISNANDAIAAISKKHEDEKKN